MRIKKTYLFGPIVVALLLWFVLEATTQPGVKDLPGNPEELAFVRNENNTGPVRRIYYVSIQDTLWDAMKSYGGYMPHNKYGNTQVYFFAEGQDLPNNIELDSTVPEQFQSICLARYEKDAMGKESFTPYPYLP